MATGHQVVGPLFSGSRENVTAIVHALGDLWPQERGNKWSVEDDTELILVRIKKKKILFCFVF